MNWKHIVFLIASGVGAAATALLKIDPSHADIWTAVIAGAGCVVTFFGAISPAMVGGAKAAPLAALGILTVFVGVSTSACQGTIPSNVVQGGVATLETAICIMNVATKDAGKPVTEVIADAIIACSSDAATVARVLDASHAAERAACSQDAGR